MPQLFEFSDMFAEWETEFSVLPREGGHYDQDNGGVWVPNRKEPEEMRGIVVPLTNDDLRFDTGGNYTQKDKKVYVLKPLFLKIDDRIRYRKQDYRVLEQKIYDEYADFNIYIAKLVTTKGRINND